MSETHEPAVSPGTPTFGGTSGRPAPRPTPTDRAERQPLPGSYPMPGPIVRSLAGLATALQILLLVNFAAAIAMLFAALRERDLIRRLVADPTSVSLAEADSADQTLNTLSVLALALYVATGIVWLVWFHRARTNVEAWAPVFQRRGPGWAIGAWFVPLVNLFWPAMIAKDVLIDSERRPGDSEIWRPQRPLVVVWGLAFAAMALSGLYLRSIGNNTDAPTAGASDFLGYADALVVNVALTAVAVIPAVLLVRRLTDAQRARVEFDATVRPG